MYPHERSLVKRLAGKPFAILGVNSDDKRDDLKKAMEKEQITWRSWFEGSKGGPIATRWNVQGWPTLYVVDARGIIRHKYFGPPGDDVLDEVIDGLVKETNEDTQKK
jgi:hypothetical protein